MQAMFERKPSDFMPHEFEIAKTVQLPAAQFQSLLVAPLRDYDFIKEHADLMYCDENHVFHCLLLTGEGRTDGLLVESDGAAYCRYAAYVPAVSGLITPPALQLKDLLRTRWEDIHLMHKDVEVEPCTIVELDAHTLTPAGKEAWADVLSAEVSKIYTGYYGLQLELDGVKPRRLEEFSSMLSGYCSVQDYEKWVTEGAEAPSQSPEMKL